MKEQSELQPIVDAYKEYKACQQTVEESLMMLDEESDEEMREMLKEELSGGFPGQSGSRAGMYRNIKASLSGNV